MSTDMSSDISQAYSADTWKNKDYYWPLLGMMAVGVIWLVIFAVIAKKWHKSANVNGSESWLWMVLIGIIGIALAFTVGVGSVVAKVKKDKTAAPNSSSS